jgi:rhomboid family GlyGly-CTERM serine protease
LFLPRLPGRSWLLMTVLLAKASVIAWFLPAVWLDWQPGLAWREPWRAFSAVFVHWSVTHLVANLLGALVVALLGLAMQAPSRLTWAWCAAWPLTQLGLLLRPELAHYGGLSGVMHAGVAAAALWLVLNDSGARRAIGAGLLIGLISKLLWEQPWGPTLRDASTANTAGSDVGAGWDIAIAPLAHSTGALAGGFCAFLAWLTRPHANGHNSRSNPA